MPKPSSIRSAVSIEHRLVTDGRTDTGPWLVPRMHSIATVGLDHLSLMDVIYGLTCHIIFGTTLMQ